jgi:hypothetical protein
MFNKLLILLLIYLYICDAFGQNSTIQDVLAETANAK